MLKQAKEDRNLAKQAYEFFKDIVDNSTNSEDLRDIDARKCMIECLKLMQSAQNVAIKVWIPLSKQKKNSARAKALLL